MATRAVATSTGAVQLAGSTVDTVSFSGLNSGLGGASNKVLVVSNEDSSEGLTFSVDGTTNPTQGEADFPYVPAGKVLQYPATSLIYVVGNSNNYSAQIVPVVGT